MDFNFYGFNALVCGSTQGIGLATARKLASLGARVTLLARNQDKLAKECAALPAPNHQAHDYIVANFNEPEKVQQVVAGHFEDMGPVHMLINNTGGPPGGPLAAAGIDELRLAFEQHIIGSHLLLQQVLPGMKEAGYGRVVNIISTSVKIPIPGLGVSNTIRGAMANWAKTLSVELASYGITVNNVLPGFTETARLDAIIQNRAGKTGNTEDAVAEALRQSVPAGRFGQSEELANAVAFLCSEQAAYINGINLPVDGGRTGSL